MTNKCILIVEDERAIADTVSYALKKEGYTSHHVLDGTTALAYLAAEKNSPACLIILDVGLPDINGFDLCRKIRQFADTPVIFLTARNDEVDRIVGLEIGADDYVLKPFSPRELVARVRAILRRQHDQTTQVAKPPITPPRFNLRLEAGRIDYFGQSLNLTRYEYLLLKTFIERPEQLLTRAQLMDLVWVNANETLERTIDGHIKTLRAKMREINQNDDPIQTHRGLGYSLHLK
ncbi:MAG: two-component system response regulator CreB [Burkholderiaceae bacterium]|nr:two-component system response regulator CreB [Burkholderiaceae bacterium]